MAAGSYERKDIVGGAPQTTISPGISAAASSITIADATGWPDGTNGSFVVAVDLGGASEEKILCSSRTGTTLTVETRGYDDTTGVTHADGATIDHVLDASTIDQANRYVNLQDSKGEWVVHNGTNPVAFDPGLAGDGSDDEYVIQALDSEATGFTFGKLVTVKVDASLPAATGVQQIAYDTTNNEVYVTNGTDWFRAVDALVVADDTARDSLVGATPDAGTWVYRTDYDFVERYTEGAWKPLTTPTFADTTARDAYYTSPSDGDKARISGTYAEYDYRQDEWIITNFKVTVAASAPADPHDGDIWLQPSD